MKTYISNTRINMLSRVLGKHGKNKNYRFCVKNDLSAREDKLELELEVSWSAIGAVSAQEALAFANDLKRGAELARAIGGLDIYYEWDSKDTIITNRKIYDREFDKLEKMYEKNPLSLVDWIIDGIGLVQE